MQCLSASNSSHRAISPKVPSEDSGEVTEQEETRQDDQERGVQLVSLEVEGDTQEDEQKLLMEHTTLAGAVRALNRKAGEMETGGIPLFRGLVMSLRTIAKSFRHEVFFCQVIQNFRHVISPRGLVMSLVLIVARTSSDTTSA